MNRKYYTYTQSENIIQSWIDFYDIMLSEISQRKTNTV